MNYGIAALAQERMRPHILPGAFCIDATAGNGHDTLFLCEQVGENGSVLAFDIQRLAIENTRKRLQERHMEERAVLICGSHCDMEKHAKEGSVSCITFNLGYLPGGDHALATRADTTLAALEQSLRLLKKDGLLSVVIYSGGDTGYEEKEAVMAWLRNLDEKKYLVIANEFINRPNDPPIPVQVIKIKQ